MRTNDIVRLLHQDHVRVRQAFAVLDGTRRIDALEAPWKAVSALLCCHVAGTLFLSRADELGVDAGRRRAIEDSAIGMRRAIEAVDAQPIGSRRWWDAVATVRRIFSTSVVGADEALVTLLRAALDDTQRVRLGEDWSRRSAAASNGDWSD